MIYIVVILLLLVLIYHYDIKGNKTNRSFYYDLIFVILTVIAGMRYRLGVDTTAYLYHFYHDIPYLWNLTVEDFALDSEPLWKLMNSFVLSMGGRWYVVQFIQAAFVHYFLFRYFKKHSRYIFSCVLFYFVWMYMFYTMQEMRASMSVVLCLYGNDCFLEKKWGKGYLLFFIGCLFHKSTYALLIAPLLIGLMQSNVTAFITIVIAFIVSKIVQSQVNDFLDLFAISESIDNKVQGYALSETYGEQNGNINYFIVNIIPFLFYPLLLLWRKRNVSENILSLKPLLLIGLLFLILQCNIAIFYRYVHFYACYIIFFIVELYMNTLKYRKINTIYDITTSSGVAIIKSFLLFFLLYVSIGKICLNYSCHYYPYSSIIDRNIDANREKLYNSVGYPGPKNNEY